MFFVFLVDGVASISSAILNELNERGLSTNSAAYISQYKLHVCLISTFAIFLLVFFDSRVIGSTPISLVLGRILCEMADEGCIEGLFIN